MPSMQRAREYDGLIGTGLVTLFVLGLFFAFVLDNWAILETGISVSVFVLVLYLFYRLVVAVEHLAYDS